MRICDSVHCQDFPCVGVNHAGYHIPSVELSPEKFKVMLISEAVPVNLADDYYAAGDPLFQQTTVQAFRDAGTNVSSIQDILNMGIYLTSAVKCSKVEYTIPTATIKTCSFLLEQELSFFSNIQVYLLMGDVAIKALNTIAKRNGEPAVIPAGSTYKIRGGIYTYRGARAFPSYLQAGPSFFIEKVKRKMIAEDITAALRLVA